MEKENILVIRSKVFSGYETGLHKISKEELEELLEENKIFLERAEELENDESYLQVIPYVSIIFQNSVLSACRTKQVGEKRLIGKRLIGFGGHVNEVDIENKTFEQWMEREMEEELDIKSKVDKITYNGILMDRRDKVGLHHIGISMAVSLFSKEVKIRESESFEDSKWIEFYNLEKYMDSFEGWSELVAKFYSK